jgi:hypothetical protein
LIEMVVRLPELTMSCKVLVTPRLRMALYGVGNSCISHRVGLDACCT